MKAVDLFHAWSVKFSKDKAHLHPSPEAKTVLALMDHFNDLHYHDRNRMREIDALRAELAALKPKRPGGIHEPDGGCGKDWA